MNPRELDHIRSGPVRAVARQPLRFLAVERVQSVRFQRVSKHRNPARRSELRSVNHTWNWIQETSGSSGKTLGRFQKYSVKFYMTAGPLYDLTLPGTAEVVTMLTTSHPS
jgi:hypothetical protein